MKYKLLKSEKLPVAYTEKRIIYIIPLSSSHKNFAVIYPAIPAGSLLRSLLDDKVELHRFKGCPDIAIEKVKQALGDLIHKELKEASAKQSTMWVMGIVLIGLGVINFIFPDPIILLDEILIIAGGGWMLASGIKLKKIHTTLKNRKNDIEKKINDLPVFEDPLCSGIFASIQAKDELIIKEFKEDFSIESLKDRIEVEARWYVDYINIEELISGKHIQKADVRNIMNGIDCIVPLKKIVYLEKNINKKMIKNKNTLKLSQKLKNIKKQIIQKCGFSDDALTVYSEFYKSALDYFATQGEKL